MNQLIGWMSCANYRLPRLAEKEIITIMLHAKCKGLSNDSFLFPLFSINTLNELMNAKSAVL